MATRHRSGQTRQRRWRRVEKKAVKRMRKATTPAPEVISDPVESAQAAGLRDVSDTQPGIRRKRAGKGFVPSAETVLEEGDEILAVLDPGKEDDLKALFGPEGNGNGNSSDGA